MNIGEANDVQRLLRVLDGSTGGSIAGAEDAVTRLATRAAKALQGDPRHDASAVRVALGMLRSLPARLNALADEQEMSGRVADREVARLLLPVPLAALPLLQDAIAGAYGVEVAAAAHDGWLILTALQEVP